MLTESGRLHLESWFCNLNPSSFNKYLGESNCFMDPRVCPTLMLHPKNVLSKPRTGFTGFGGPQLPFSIVRPFALHPQTIKPSLAVTN